MLMVIMFIPVIWRGVIVIFIQWLLKNFNLINSGYFRYSEQNVWPNPTPFIGGSPLLPSLYLFIYFLNPLLLVRLLLNKKHYCYKMLSLLTKSSVYLLSSTDTPYMDYSPIPQFPFLQENFDPASYDFLKLQTP